MVLDDIIEIARKLLFLIDLVQKRLHIASMPDDCFTYIGLPFADPDL